MHDEVASRPHILPRFSSNVESNALSGVLQDVLNDKVKWN